MMKFPFKSSLQAKILAGFLAVTLLSLVVGALGWNGLRFVAARMSAMGSIDLPAMEVIARISSNQCKVKVAVCSLVNPEVTRAERTAFYGDVEAALAGADKAIADFDRLPKEPKVAALWQEFGAKWQAWVADSRQSVAISRKIDQLAIDKPQKLAKVVSLVSEIAQASEEQAKGTRQINQAVTEMGKITQQNAASAEETASASESMSALASEAQRVVDSLAALVNGGQATQAARELWRPALAGPAPLPRARSEAKLLSGVKPAVAPDQKNNHDFESFCGREGLAFPPAFPQPLYYTS